MLSLCNIFNDFIFISKRHVVNDTVLCISLYTTVILFCGIFTGLHLPGTTSRHQLLLLSTLHCNTLLHLLHNILIIGVFLFTYIFLLCVPIRTITILSSALAFVSAIPFAAEYVSH